MEEIYKCCDCGKPTGNKRVISMTRGNDLIIHRCDECQDKLSAEIEWQNEQWQEDNIICPWCNDCFSEYEEMLQVTDSPYEDFVGTVKCPSCGKEFDLEIETKCTYTTKKLYKLFDYAQWCENQQIGIWRNKYGIEQGV